MPCLFPCPKIFGKPANWSARHVDSCGIAAEMLRPHSAQREEAQLRPAESEVPGTEISSPILIAILIPQNKIVLYDTAGKQQCLCSNG
ncbi:hypothetical protein N288_02675 [Bacillus infantis NRRL B-14911]|uniref:Uncharacterized protein n=1 Tax=Bacillus infantis NRRL B-14911 TaxID=1367477 RepID=U5L4H0_9BACI|nr:hypothetical protein N288_02675 [Bacillus infantis NRRL B-14911]